MRKINQLAIIPEGSIIDKNIAGKIDYFDTFCLSFKSSRKYCVDELSARIFSYPDWLKALLGLRDLIARPFGLAVGSDLKQEKDHGQAFCNMNQHTGPFATIDRTESEIVMAEDDKHLYLRVSVLLESKPADNLNRLYLTTLVQFHNLGGNFYFAAIKPFHKAIMKALLARVVNEPPTKDG